MKTNSTNEKKNVQHHFYRWSNLVVGVLFFERKKKEMNVIQLLTKSTYFLSSHYPLKPTIGFKDIYFHDADESLLK